MNISADPDTSQPKKHFIYREDIWVRNYQDASSPNDPVSHPTS